MFEAYTFDKILQDMLDKVSDDVDKREGSVIYDALAPAAYALANQYWELSNFADLVFCDTAVSEYLDRVVKSYGLSRKAATKAVRRLETADKAAVEIGSRWMLNELVYAVTELLEEGVYVAECETAGKAGNLYSGELSNLSGGNGVSATLTGIITDGADEETDDALRERMYEKIQAPATSGNANHYKQWAMAVSGVGAAKVIPLDSGPGTVTVLVVNSDMETSDTLPATVLEYIEAQRPIGADVTVKSPEAVTVSVAANVLLDGTKTIAAVQEAFKTKLTDTLKDMIFSATRVSYAKILGALLDVDGIEDADGMKLNGSVANVSIGEKQIPVVGTVTLTEVASIETD